MNAKCINQYGSYVCECLDGFIPIYDDEFKCEDHDECASSCDNDCDPDYAYCNNLIGSYLCVCKKGFYGDGKLNGCYDIDECSQTAEYNSNFLNCDENAKCVNKIGSYECICLLGFGGNGTFCEGNLIYSWKNILFYAWIKMFEIYLY